MASVATGSTADISAPNEKLEQTQNSLQMPIEQLEIDHNVKQKKMDYDVFGFKLSLLDYED